ncbi:hypothetical protein GCM10022202_31370 [Microbacterium marinilacus]|uniref:Energy-coupling factor transporter transmembrane protein EcfT n=2 Tax=Microbacterium marinilacus TaxID=415209 RepID=A0ABP7BSX4_9MICO
MKLVGALPPIVLVMFTRDITTPALIAAAAAIAILTGARLHIRTILVGSGLLLVLTAWTTFSFALLARPESVAHTPVLVSGWITLRVGAVEAGAATAARLVAMVMLVLLASLGTTTAALISALVRQARVPYRFAYGAVTAARFVPRYRQDLLTIRTAQQARGVIERPGPLGYLRRTARLLVPLLAGGARHAERLSLAMDARGFGAHARRSDRDPAFIRPRDIIFVVVCWGVVAIIFASTAARDWLDLAIDVGVPS